ncbi:hypothetical protein TSOC_006818 [Tetrabaena socialis]|uniref:Uncharacterized protein n=1 Tax=Tetrabaena socialis TaxID=47790 RepID=A0A2J8A2L2_9CHLO|nr:hypothetical protein TSOC_006818 [Tetrabaena socialis]|eukprot:PNH06754.1 hypothetical protein TSOC_006818 [Tetrabaena socialis]
MAISSASRCVVILVFLASLCRRGDAAQQQLEQPIHPLCAWPNVRAHSVHDLSAFLHGALPAGTVAPGSCIFNPALVHVSENVYLVATRLYLAKKPSRRCVLGNTDHPPMLDYWAGKQTNLLALIKIIGNTGNARLDFELMGHSVIDLNLEGVHIQWSKYEEPILISSTNVMRLRESAFFLRPEVLPEQRAVSQRAPLALTLL